MADIDNRRLKLLKIHYLQEGFADLNWDVTELTDEDQWVARRLFCVDGFYVLFHWHWKMKGCPANVRRWIREPGCLGVICCYAAGLPEEVFEQTVLFKYHEGRHCETAVAFTDHQMRIFCIPDTEVSKEDIKNAPAFRLPFMRKHFPTVMKLRDWWVSRDA